MMSLQRACCTVLVRAGGSERSILVSKDFTGLDLRHQSRLQMGFYRLVWTAALQCRDYGKECQESHPSRHFCLYESLVYALHEQSENYAVYKVRETV